MVLSIPLMFYVLAAILFFLAALPNPRPWFIPIGLMCLTLGMIVVSVGLKAP